MLLHLVYYVENHSRHTDELSVSLEEKMVGGGDTNDDNCDI